MHKTYLLGYYFFLFSFINYAQNHQERFDALDVLHYKFDIKLSDTTDVIEAIAEIKIKFKKTITHFNLDLVQKKTNAKGMFVYFSSENGNLITYTQTNDQLSFKIDTTKTNEIRTYTIKYKGIPADGLVISKNKYHERTFFGDNWPDRGKNWLPLVDHPSDKATVEWLVTAPSYYQTIANGLLIERTNINKNETLTYWKMDKPIPTKVMVIGVARFAVENQNELHNIELSSWVYPQDRKIGFSDYAKATNILEFMIDSIGAYPFHKLAHIQSKTRFGGMENAGNIFYDENSITGTGSNEALIAHEVAHQWFGNSASELNWHHIWLSEGFATYFTNLYYESKYGKDLFKERLKSDRQIVINYAKKNYVPIVNTEVKNYMQLLNPNSYKKGSWVLHMLRKELGDQLFWKGIRDYYNTYKYSNALSEDLQKTMEKVSGKDLALFFKQWLYQAGHPQLAVQWKNTTKGFLHIEIKQTQQSKSFHFPLEIKINYRDGRTVIKTISISKKIQKVKIPIESTITSILLDPNTWLLFELDSLKKLK